MNETQTRIRILETEKSIAHTMMHRMSLLQKIWMPRVYSSFRKTYDSACEELSNSYQKEQDDVLRDL